MMSSFSSAWKSRCWLRRSLGWFLLLVLSLPGPGVSVGATPSPSEAAAASTTPAKAPRGRVVVLGDSITAGYGLPDANEAYPALLQAKIGAAGLPFEVNNAGVSGDTTASGLHRVDWALGRGGVEVLVIALGGNDGLRGLSPEQTAANLTGIVEKARAKAPGVAVIVAGMKMPDNMGKEFVEQFRAVFPKVATEQKAQLLPYLLEGVGGVPSLNQADMIHPSAAGQERVAANVWTVLEPILRARAKK